MYSTFITHLLPGSPDSTVDGDRLQGFLRCAVSSGDGRARNGGTIGSSTKHWLRRALRGNFLCECGDSLCPEHVPLTAEEYEQLPTHPPGLALAAGHKLPLPSRDDRCPECGCRRG
jgi:hypothetical protein